MKPFLLLLAALPAFCQTPDATPTTFYAFGVSALTQSSPKPTGWVVVAHLIQKSAQLWSFSESDYTYAKLTKQVQSSVRTGIATPLRKFGTVTVYGLGDGGVASTGTSAGFAVAGGLCAPIDLGRKSGFQFVPGWRLLHTATGGTQNIVEFGIGWR